MRNDKFPDVDEPLNVDERYLYAMVMRLDALCHMMSSLLQHIADKENVAVEQVKVAEKSAPSRKKKAGGGSETV
jgi:hypothetical protein